LLVSGHVVRGDTRLAPVRDNPRHHRRPVRDSPALGLLRGGALAVRLRRRRDIDPGEDRRHRRPRRRVIADRLKSSAFTFAAFIILAAFLSPLFRTLTVSIKSPEQVADVHSPLFPATAEKYTYQSRDYDVYQVPIDATTKDLALVKKGRDSSEFVDPANADAGPVTWQASWRTLEPAYQFDPQWQNYATVWN